MKNPRKALICGLALLAAIPTVASAENAVSAPAASAPATEPKALQTAIFAGGCFWGVEGVFSHVIGVTSAVSGYHGGDANAAEYATVSTGDTSHAESVRVTYDPSKIRYDQLLRIFFSAIADPTQLNYQGPDHGSQYRSALVPMTPEQRRVATAYLAQLRTSGLWKEPLVTKIETYRKFYPAEAYHQDFMLKNPGQTYTTIWDVPRIAALKRLYPGAYKADFTKD
jgi:peptide-methionine (S)-S-oxide reductase